MDLGASPVRIWRRTLTVVRKAFVSVTVFFLVLSAGMVRMTYSLLTTGKLTEIERMCDGGSHAAGASSEPEGIVYCLLLGLGLGRGRRRRDHGLICCRLLLHGCLRCLFRDRRYGGLFGIRRQRPSKASADRLHCCLYTSEQKSTRVLADQGSAVRDGACYGASVEIGRDERICTKRSICYRGIPDQVAIPARLIQIEGKKICRERCRVEGLNLAYVRYVFV